MNKSNDYTYIWKLANEELEKYGMQIELKKDKDDSYAVIVRNKNGQSECFAEGYYEDELGDVINEAWTYARAAQQALGRPCRLITLGVTPECPLEPLHRLTEIQF